LSVERDDAANLLAQLESEFAAGAAQVVRLEEYDMAFVPCDDEYWLAHTCADVAAGWLERLGCRITSAPIRISVRTRANSRAMR